MAQRSDPMVAEARRVLEAHMETSSIHEKTVTLLTNKVQELSSELRKHHHATPRMGKAQVPFPTPGNPRPYSSALQPPTTTLIPGTPDVSPIVSNRTKYAVPSPHSPFQRARSRGRSPLATQAEKPKPSPNTRVNVLREQRKRLVDGWKPSKADVNDKPLKPLPIMVDCSIQCNILPAPPSPKVQASQSPGPALSMTALLRSPTPSPRALKHSESASTHQNADNSRSQMCEADTLTSSKDKSLSPTALEILEQLLQELSQNTEDEVNDDILKDDKIVDPSVCIANDVRVKAAAILQKAESAHERLQERIKEMVELQRNMIRYRRENTKLRGSVSKWKQKHAVVRKFVSELQETVAQREAQILEMQQRLRNRQELDKSQREFSEKAIQNFEATIANLRSQNLALKCSNDVLSISVRNHCSD